MSLPSLWVERWHAHHFLCTSLPPVSGSTTGDVIKLLGRSLTGSWAPSLVTRPCQCLKGLILVGKALCLSQSTEPLIAL